MSILPVSIQAHESGRQNEPISQVMSHLVLPAMNVAPVLCHFPNGDIMVNMMFQHVDVESAGTECTITLECSKRAWQAYFWNLSPPCSHTVPSST